jgi:AcrR family transcriptional regulator
MTLETPDAPRATAPPGRRERKKAATRRAISDVATRLFIERGFDAVTVAEVAEAADVAVKTIFNHFGSKEELFLDRGAELREAVVAAVADRPRGQTITGALLALLSDHRLPGDEGWTALRDAAARGQLRRFFAAWRDSASLQGRLLLWNEGLHERLCAVLGRELRIAEADDRLQAMAAMLVAAVHLRHRKFTAAVLADVPPEEVERRVRSLAAEVLGRVAVAFPELDARRR